MIDYDLLPEIVGDTPVVWTLHDMMPFTGGCHYSEGCERFHDACTACPLISEANDLPHRALIKKRNAISKLTSVAIITPSAWLTQKAENSSVFGGCRVETIPNIFSAEAFQPTARLVARQKLGLPLDKKLVVFGADSLNNLRKGGDILAQAVRHLQEMGKAEDIEGVFFGANSLDLGIKAYNMGHISDEAKLSLVYAAGDVFAFPSREDNAPLTVAESLLSGTPVVGFPVGNVPELVRHKETGYIAKYEDAKDFAVGLAWALEDTNSAEARLRGLYGHLTARAHNDTDTSVKRQVSLYHQLLEL
jgi:glycosyltransferase involved in cell wall biosynthesis